MTETPAGPGQSLGNMPEYSVSELSLRLKRTVEEAFGLVRVRGEISGFKRAASGHLYLTLKDADAALDAVMWRGTAQRLAFRPEDGLEVICTGRLTTYPGRSRYQLVVEQMAPAGVGALLAQLEERRRRLAAEGLFEAGRKRPLPYLPEVIGVITSPTGAVIRDILHRLRERFPRRVLIWPVLVQGEQAAAQVAAAIAGFNRLAPGGPIPRPDLLIVARGGGSIEDLWAFNEEAVVRAAAASDIPLISAVGHETDTTLIDFASDRRAPTPTAAAEIAVPVLAEIELDLLDRTRRLKAAWLREQGTRRERLSGLARGLGDPRLRLEAAVQRLDDLAEHLRHALTLGLERRRGIFAAIAARLRPEQLRREMAQKRRDLDRAAARLSPSFAREATRRKERLMALAARLESLSWRRVLDRGYALVRDRNGKTLTRAAAAGAAERLRIEFADGEVAARVESGSSESGRTPPRSTRTKTDPPQGSLL